THIVVDTVHLPAFLGEVSDNFTADEAGASSHEYAFVRHPTTPLARRRTRPLECATNGPLRCPGNIARRADSGRRGVALDANRFTLHSHTQGAWLLSLMPRDDD